MRPLLPLALALVVLPACITQDIRPAPRANTPPSIVSAPTAAHPLSEIIRLAPGGGDAGLTTFSAPVLDVIVRDCDISQDLTALIWVDERADRPADAFVRVPANGTGSRSLTISNIALDRLQVEGCHRIELFVSSAFVGGAFFTPEPQEEGDLGTAVWWVATRVDPDDTSPIDMTDCPE